MYLIGILPTNIMVMMVAKMSADVEKLESKINPQTNAVKIIIFLKADAKSCFVFCFFPKTFAVKRIKEIFATSAG
jgi:hypothetical protein